MRDTPSVSLSGALSRRPWLDLQTDYQAAFAYQAVLGLYPLQFIRKLRLAYIVCIVFLNEEYLNALVDFICSSRGRLERDRGFSNPLSLSNTSPDPWGIRCGGALLLPRAYRDLVSLCPVLSLLPSSEFCTAICVRLCIVRVSVGLLGLGRSFFIGGGRSFVSATTSGLALGIRGLFIPATTSGLALGIRGLFVLRLRWVLLFLLQDCRCRKPLSDSPAPFGAWRYYIHIYLRYTYDGI